MCWKSFAAALLMVFLVACGDSQPVPAPTPDSLQELYERLGQPTPTLTTPEWTMEEAFQVLRVLEDRVSALEDQQGQRGGTWNATDHSHSDLHNHNLSPWGSTDHTHPNDHRHDGW